MRRLAIFFMSIAVFVFSVPPARAAKDQFVPVPTLGILYFENATGAEHLSWLPKVFSDLVIRDLSRTGRVKAAPRSAVESAVTTYRDQKSSPHTNRLLAIRFGKILGVTHLVTGRFHRHDTDLVIEVRIYDIEKGKQLGWRQVEGPSDDLPYIMKEAELKMLEILDIRPSDRELIDLVQIPTKNSKALAFYSHGLDALDQGDREQARSYFQTALGADRYFKPAADALSGLAFVLSGKAILRAETSETAVVGTAGIKSVADLLELARTNAFDFSVGEAATSPVEGDTTTANVKLPLNVSVRPDYVNLWLYSIRRLGREMADTGPTRQLSVTRKDLFDNPVVLSVPEILAEEWISGWAAFKMRLVFQGVDGNTLFETPRISVLPLYIGDAEGEFDGRPAVHWQVESAYEVERVPKQFFNDPLQVTLEIDR